LNLNRLRLWVVVMLLALAAGTAFAQAQANGDAALSARVDLAVEAQQKAQKIPGVSLAVCRDGKIMKAAGYGLANVELNVPMTPETVLQTGSVGKQFTSMAVLFEEAKLGLDDKIAKYIPESPTAWNDVTVRELLTHTSGIPDYGSAEAMNKGVIDLRKDYTESQLIEASRRCRWASLRERNGAAATRAMCCSGLSSIG